MRFCDLNESQLLALAITAEEEDGRIYRDFAQELRKNFPATAELFEHMADEESGHRHRLIELYQKKFGEHIPLVRRQDVKGFMVPRSSLLLRTLRPEKAREQAALMEVDARRFYEAAAQQSKDAAVRQLLGDLAQEEQRHETVAEKINEKQAADGEVDIEQDMWAKAFCIAYCPARLGRADGWVGFNLGPSFCGCFCHGQYRGNF